MKKKYIWHIILIAYILFIFSNSLTPAVVSSKESGFVLRTIHQCLNAVGLSAPWLNEHIVRKCAHFTEYAIMGFLLCQSVKQLELMAEVKRHIHMTAIFFIPFVDETLQLFTEGRSGQVSDVWLDMSGAVFGTLFSALFSTILVRVFKNKK